VALAPGSSAQLGEFVAVAVPADWAAYRAVHGATAAAKLRAETAAAMEQALSGGLVAQSCQRVDADVAVYLFGADA
jgi:hypothetical protein